MKYRIMYRRARVSVDLKKANACKACPHKGRTEMHHYLYAYKTSEVRARPGLASDNTIELCYNCHRLADALRKIMKDPYIENLYEQNKDAMKSSASPTLCFHIWTAPLPGELKPGIHAITVKATDVSGKTFRSSRIFRVE